MVNMLIELFSRVKSHCLLVKTLWVRAYNKMDGGDGGHIHNRYGPIILRILKRNTHNSFCGNGILTSQIRCTFY